MVFSAVAQAMSACALSGHNDTPEASKPAKFQVVLKQVTVRIVVDGEAPGHVVVLHK